jgi:serine/threonine protein phosphatase PrpC
MSRSIGDKAAEKVGVCPIPEIREYRLTPADKFILLASDGIWEFLTSHLAVKLAASSWESGAVDVAAERLLAKSRKLWIQSRHSVDDITIVTAFLPQSESTVNQLT